MQRLTVTHVTRWQKNYNMHCAVASFAAHPMEAPHGSNRQPENRVGKQHFASRGGSRNDKLDLSPFPPCLDGPHAPAQIPLQIDRLECSYYTASCHKWLSAPFGSGFLYVAPEKQHQIRPQQLSWGTLPPATPTCWDDEFLWNGTRDPSAYLGIAAAINFIEDAGIELFRERTHHLARYARENLSQLPGASVITPDHPDWYGSMSLVRLADGDCLDLQRRLWENHRIEVPIVDFGGRRYVRVSCHLYNRYGDIDALDNALRNEL